MRALSASDLVGVWEAGAHLDQVGRPLAILAAAYPELTRQQLDTLTVGDRDAHLLDVREAILGPSMSSLARCPQCGEDVEFTISTAGIRVEPPPEAAPLALDLEGGRLVFRLPDSTDLAAAAGIADPSTARRRLAERCIAAVPPELGTFQDLPDSVLAALGERILQCDPQSEVLLCLNCPACGKRWPLLFDIASFLWSEIGALARRLLNEVHILASAYGWRERDIVSMSAVRRHAYLEMLS